MIQYEKKIGLIYSKKLDKIDFERCFFNAYIQNIEIIYPYTQNCNNIIKQYADKNKIPILNINLGNTELDFLKSCQQVVKLSDTTLAICKSYESGTSIIKGIIKYAATLNKKIVVYKQEKEQFYTSKGDLLCGQNIL